MAGLRTTRLMRWLRRSLVALSLFALTVWLVILIAPGFGSSPKGERQARVEASPQWRDGRFHNTEPMWVGFFGFRSKPPTSGWAAESARTSKQTTPSGDEVPAVDTAALLATPPATGLRLTWFGHSSMLLEIDGRKLLIDPIWSQHATPIEPFGPKRWFAAPIALEKLHDVDAVLISHDHYDHLDYPSIAAMRGWKNMFIVPLGVGAHLQRWGIPANRIVELDWWQDTGIGDLQIASTPARHASGRVNPQGDKTLWSGYAMIGPIHRVWYSGDTGLHSLVPEIGKRFGPFDLTLVETGQYNWQWPDWHTGPEQAALAHKQAGGRIFVPIHWALLNLAPHNWTEPGERSIAAAKCFNVDIALPVPGRPWEPGTPTVPWWPRNVSWSPAAQTPIISSRDGDRAHPLSGEACLYPPASPH